MKIKMDIANRQTLGATNGLFDLQNRKFPPIPVVFPYSLLCNIIEKYINIELDLTQVGIPYIHTHSAVK